MGLVVLIIALVIINYRQLILRYPQGGGAAAATGEAFGDRWAFLPIGALIVDFVLTIAISVSAVASAVIAFFPALGTWRLPLAVALVVMVGAHNLRHAFTCAVKLMTGCSRLVDAARNPGEAAHLRDRRAEALRHLTFAAIGVGDGRRCVGLTFTSTPSLAANRGI